ncbi:hypothetical protein FB451DRAFT_1085037 [Mycena latifolia]|nr:hypothetical protein FB451DRAFT_1085037 [Mycena latifolia]
MAHPNFLLNARILVIGGSSGIGFAVASASLANAAKVCITSATAQKLSAKIAELRTLYPDARIAGSSADLSSVETLEANLQSILDAAVKELGGPLDHIVYTAVENPTRTSLAETTTTTALAPFTVLYLGPLLVAKLLAANPGRYLNPAASSSITLTSGNTAHRPLPGISALIGAMGAVEVLSRGLAVDLAPIRVNVIIPGAVQTELMERLTAGNPDMFKHRSLTGLVGTPEAAAEAYLFAMRSVLATGQGFKIDNGGSLA